MRILQLINALTWGGAQILVLDLCRFLAGHGHRVVVATFRDGPVGSLLRREGVEVVVLPETGFDLIGFMNLGSLLRSFRPHLIHTHLFRASFWGRLARCQCPTSKLVTSLHGLESPGYHRLERKMARFSDRLVFPSQYLVDWYTVAIREMPLHRTVLAFPGAIVQDLPPSRFAGKLLKIGTLSRLHPVKGLDTLIEACAILKDGPVSFEILIGGDGKDRSRLEQLAREKGLASRIHFAGSISSSKQFLDQLDLFVAPSRQESFGITVCEAMERGLPVIAANVGGIRETIESNLSGILVAPDQPEALANQIARLLSHPLERVALGQAARQRIIHHFNRRDWLEAHLQLYHSLAESQKKVHVAITSNELGGGERMAISLARGLKARGWSLSATCSGEPLASHLTSEGIPVSTASMKAGGLFFAARLMANLKKIAPDLIHAHLNKAALISGLFRKLASIPVAGHVHGLNRASYYRWNDALLAVSKAVSEHLTDQGIDPSKVHILPNCLDKPVETIQRAPGPPWIIAIPAKLHVNKGHAWALAAIERYLTRLPDIKIWVFGDGPEKEALTKRFSSGPLGKKLIFWGFKNDLDQYFPAIHLVLLPSLGEGIPLSLLEAMRWRIPIVATNVGGIPEIVVEGKNGFMVAPQDEEALVSAMARALSQPLWNHMGAEATIMYKQRNSFHSLVDSLEQIFLRLIS